MNRVVFWEGEDKLCCDTLLVRSTDVSFFDEFRASGQLNILVKRALRVRPALEDDRDLALLYAAVRYSDSIDAVDPEARAGRYAGVLEAWERIRGALQSLDWQEYWRARKGLEAESPPILWAIVSGWVSVLDGYVECCGAICWAAPYEVLVRESHRPVWWRTRPKLASSVERLEAGVREALADYGGLRDLAKKLEGMKSLVIRLELSGNPRQRPSEPFVIASSYCFAAARAASRVGLAALGLVLIHRALELMLTAVAIEAGLVQLGARRPCFSRAAGGDELVSLTTLQAALSVSGQWAKDERRDELLRAVNATRNDLHYTHGLSCVSADSADQVVDEAYAQLRRIDPTGVWAKAVAVWSPEIEVPFSFLFTASEHFGGFFEVLLGASASDGTQSD